MTIELRVAVQPPDGPTTDVTVSADPGLSTDRLVQALAARLAARLTRDPGRAAAYCVRRAIWLDPGMPVERSGIRWGDQLVLATRPDSPDGPPPQLDLYELVVASGVDAGLSRGVRVGTLEVGRDPARCDLVLSDPEVSGLHLHLKATATAVSVADAGSTNGTLVAGRRLGRGEWMVAAPDAPIQAGGTVMEVRAIRRARGRDPDGSGRIPFNRPPRVATRVVQQPLSIPRPPDEPRSGRLAVGTIVLPALFGVAAALLMQRAEMLAFALLSPVMVAWSYVEERRAGRREFGGAVAAFRDQIQRVAAELRATRLREAEARRAGAPAPDDLLEQARTHASTLWWRRDGDADFLHVRLGLADLPSEVTVRIEPGGSGRLVDEAERMVQTDRVLPAVPVLAALPAVGSIGLSGDAGGVSGVARWLVGQAAALHSPRDLVIAAAVSTERLGEWEWLKWLPHTSTDASPLRRPMLAAGGTDSNSLILAVVTLVAQRESELQRGAGADAAPFVLVVLDEKAGLGGPQVAKILRAQARAAVGAIWIGSAAEALPADCRGIANVGETLLDWTPLGGETIRGVRWEGLSVKDCGRLARDLAPLRDVSAEVSTGELPHTLSLFELLGIHDLAEGDVIARWGGSGDRLSAPIGRAGSESFRLDLTRDGPHGLVAGTTGAGKSELLETMIAALALEHSPDRLTFLLVDYKGGSAFRQCTALPHTVGIVTDLDDHLAERALTSLNAELKRRERIFAAAGSKDLGSMLRKDPANAPARLLIVIDEFATLIREVPSFVEGVVDVAQRGRSLGVHMVLATQRPAGVVTPAIRANTNLRIALRVSDVADSDDVIGGPEAAAIRRDRPGRGYARIGQEELVEFQAAYSGTPFGGGDAAEPVAVTTFTFGAPEERRPRTSATGVRMTQLGRAVEVIRQAAETAKIRSQPAPWLPPLPAVVLLDQALDVADGRVRALLGLADEPAQQRQRSVNFDLGAHGSLLVYGTTGSGRTTLMRTIAASLALKHSPAEVQMYGIDLAAGGLKVIEALPHCGSVIVGNDEERTLRLFSMIRSTVEQRRQILSAAGAAALAELDPAERARYPRILVFLNGYGAFASAFERTTGDDLVALLPRLVADGGPAGVHFVISAERRGSVAASLSAATSKRVIFRLAEEDEYANLGLSRRQYAKRVLPPGRGFIDDGVEVQCAVVGGDPSGRGQAAAMADLGRELRERFGETLVSRIGVLPTQVDRAALPAATGPLEAVIGIRDSDLGPARISLRDGHFVVVGPYRSGRTTALRTIVSSLRESTPDLVLHLLAPRTSDLTVLDIWSTVARGVDECEAAVKELDAMLRQPLSVGPTKLVVVDDGEELLDDAVSDALASVVRRARDRGMRFVAAFERQAARRAFGGWLGEMKKEGRVLMLQPDPDVDGDFLGVRLPKPGERRDVPGRGYAIERARIELLQIARQISS